MNKNSILLVFLVVGLMTVAGCGFTPPDQYPTVDILSPADGAVFTEGNLVSIEVSASDDEGVGLVEVFANDIKFAEFTSEPYTQSWMPPNTGNYVIKARATDTINQVREDTISIIVNPGSGNPICGNGVPEQGEACDDGNDNNNDACLNTCESASCGDGFIQSGVEQCDDVGLNGQSCEPAYGETCTSCTNSCLVLVEDGGSCGDNICDPSNENLESCPDDCGATSDNLAINGDFEMNDMSSFYDHNNWLGVGYGYERATSNPISGGADVFVDISGPLSAATKRPAFAIELSEPVQAQTTYVLEFKMQSVSGESSFYGANAWYGAIVTDKSVSDLGNAVVLIKQVITPPDNSDKLLLHFDGTTVNSFRIDDIVVKSATLEPELNPPSNLDAVGNLGQIKITWNDNSIGEEGTELYVSDDGVQFTLLSTLPENVVSYTHTGLGEDVTKYYKVRAFNGVEQTAYSNVDSATTSVPPPPGSTIYVSVSDGNDDYDGLCIVPDGNGCGPWKTLAKLSANWDLVTSGTHVLFKRGDEWSPTSYPGTAMIRLPDGKSGTETERIVIGAYGTGDRPLITNRDVSRSNPSSVDYHVLLRADGNNHYITIQDLHFIGYGPVNNVPSGYECDGSPRYECYYEGYNIFRGTRSHWKILNNIFDGTHTDNEYEKNVMGLGTTSYNEIGYNEFINPTGEDTLNIRGDYNHIHHNKFINGEEEAIDMSGGTGNIVEYNLVLGTRNDWDDGGNNQNGIKIHSQYGLVTDLLFRGNIIMGAGYSADQASSYSLALQNVENSEFYNNIIFPDPDNYYGWQIGDRGINLQYGTFEGNYFANNIISGSLLIWTGGDDNIWDRLTRTNTFENNIYHKPGVSSSQTLIRVTASTNQYYSFNDWTARSGMSEEMYAQPIYVGGHWNSPTDYALPVIASNSPARNAGVNIPEWDSDFDENTVPNEGKTDVGAYEYYP